MRKFLLFILPFVSQNLEAQSPILTKFCFFLDYNQLDSCKLLLNNYVALHRKEFTYDLMEKTTGFLNEELAKLNCNVLLWKEGRYVDELNFKTLSVEEQNIRLRKSKPLILDNFILKINSSDTLFFRLRYLISKKTSVILFTKEDCIKLE